MDKPSKPSPEADTRTVHRLLDLVDTEMRLKSEYHRRLANLEAACRTAEWTEVQIIKAEWPQR